VLGPKALAACAAGKNHAPRLPQGNFGQMESLPAGDKVMSAEIAEGNFSQID
jgi:hypothetical protein